MTGHSLCFGHKMHRRKKKCHFREPFKEEKGWFCILHNFNVTKVLFYDVKYSIKKKNQKFFL